MSSLLLLSSGGLSLCLFAPRHEATATILAFWQKSVLFQGGLPPKSVEAVSRGRLSAPVGVRGEYHAENTTSVPVQRDLGPDRR